jgi:hypothetical protein
MSRTEIDGDWEAEVMGAWDTFAGERLGPDIARDARRYCPEDTGALKDSIEHHLSGEHTLVVSATGGAGGRTYAVFLSSWATVSTTRALGSLAQRSCPPSLFSGLLFSCSEASNSAKLFDDKLAAPAVLSTP